MITEEFEKVVMNMKDEKATGINRTPGIDGIPTEFLKNRSEDTLNLFMR